MNENTDLIAMDKIDQTINNKKEFKKQLKTSKTNNAKMELIEQTNVSRLILQNAGIVQDISQLNYLNGHLGPVVKKASTRGMFCDNIMIFKEISNTEINRKTGGCPILNNPQKYQEMYLSTLKNIFGDVSIKAKTVIKTSLQSQFKQNVADNNLLFRWKIALNQYQIRDKECGLCVNCQTEDNEEQINNEDTQTINKCLNPINGMLDFSNRLLQVEALDVNIYEIDLTRDLAGCANYDRIHEYLLNKFGEYDGVSGLTKRKVCGQNMVQWIDGVYRCKFYDKIIYNIECKNQNSKYGCNFSYNIDNTNDLYLEHSLNEFGRDEGLTRLEITAKCSKGLGTQEKALQTLTELTNKVNDCFDMYLNEYFEVFKNPLQNYIKNYCDIIQHQLLIKTTNNYYVVWSYNKQTQRIQGTSSKLHRSSQNKHAITCNTCVSCLSKNGICEQLKLTKLYKIDDEQEQHLSDRILSNLFLNVPLILQIDLTHKLDFGTNNKNNVFDKHPVNKILFKLPYVHTGILSKKQQFMKTSKTSEYIEQFNNPKLIIMYQQINQKRNIDHLQSRKPHILTDEDIKEQTPEITEMLNKFNGLTVKYDQTVNAEHLEDWDFSQEITERNIKLYGEYINDIVQLYKDKNELIEQQTAHKQTIKTIKEKTIKKIKHVNSIKGTQIITFIQSNRRQSKHIKKIMDNNDNLRIAIKWIVQAINKDFNTHIYYVVDVMGNMFTIDDNYFITCLNNQIGQTIDQTEDTELIETQTEEIKTKNIRYIIKYRHDDNKICSIFKTDKVDPKYTNNRTYIYCNNKDKDTEENKQTQLIHKEEQKEIKQINEEMDITNKRIEDVNERIDNNKDTQITLTNIKQTVYNKYKSIEELGEQLDTDEETNEEAKTKTIYSVEDIQYYIKGVETFYSVRLTGYDGYYKQNKYLRDVINKHINTVDEDNKQIKTAIKFKFFIDGKRYYVGDKTKKQSVIMLI